MCEKHISQSHILVQGLVVPGYQLTQEHCFSGTAPQRWEPRGLTTQLSWKVQHGLLHLFSLVSVRRPATAALHSNKHSWYSQQTLPAEWLFVCNLFPFGDTHHWSHPMTKEAERNTSIGAKLGILVNTVSWLIPELTSHVQDRSKRSLDWTGCNKEVDVIKGRMSLKGDSHRLPDVSCSVESGLYSYSNQKNKVVLLKNIGSFKMKH